MERTLEPFNLHVARALAFVLGGLALCACGHSDPSPAQTAVADSTLAGHAPVPSAQRPLLTRTYPLVPSPGLPHRLSGAQLDAYEIDLTRDQYLHATFDQRGVDLVVDVFAPGHKRLYRLDGITGAYGPEEVHVLAETAGRYRLEVTSDPGAPEGGYVTTFRELRKPTPRDRSQATADRLFHEARELDDRSSGFWEAAAKYQRAAFLYQEIGDRWHQAYAFLRLGRLYRAQPRESLDFLTRAQEIFGVLKDRHFQAAALNEIGTCRKDLADFQQSSDAYLAALALARQTREAREQATILHNLGYLYQLHGRSWQALGFFREALGLWRGQAGNEARGQEANTLTGIGWVYQSTGDWRRAIEAHRRALVLRNHLGDKLLSSISLTQIGAVWLNVDPHRALPFLERAHSLQRSIRSPRDQATTLDDMGLVFRYLERYDEAREAYSQSLEIFKSLQDLNGQAVTSINLGWMEVYRKHPREALHWFEQGFRLSRQANNPMAESGALQGMAEAERQRGDLNAAQRRAEECLRLIEAFRAAIPRRDLQSSYLAANISSYGVLVHTLMDHHRQQPARGFDLQAWYWSEQARTRSLLDALQESRRQSRDKKSHVDPTWLEERRRLLRGVGVQDARLRSPAVTDAERADAEREISELLDRLSEVDSEIRGQRRGRASDEPTMNPEVLRRQLLGENDLLLEYYLGNDRSYLWAVSANGFQSFELPGTRVLAPLIRSAYAQLSNASTPEGSSKSSLLELSRDLLGPVANQLQGKRLLIAADAIQQYIPFAALPYPMGAHEPLILHQEIVVVPSLAVIAELRGRSAERRPPSKEVAVIADPVFDASDERLAQTGYRGFHPAEDWQDVFLPRLSFAREEARAITGLVPAGGSFQALDFKASRELITQGHLSGYRILHFATHALQLTDRPELSSLVFSRFEGHGRAVEGYLRAPDIEGLDLPADLVVLSACDTVLGQTAGEELAGLPSAFLTAGAQRMLASLWQVEDESTAALMAQFYRHLLTDHHSPAQALREAQITIRMQPKWHSPRYWAGFVLLGDWQ